MYVQFSERIPGLVLDEAGKAIHIDTSKVAHAIEEVYEKYLGADLEFFSISKKYASGLYEFLGTVDSFTKDIKFLKGQITGPISYALALTDQNRRSVIYDKDLFEVLTKIISMKARWQIKKMKKVFPSSIIFIDEPYLSSVGSSYVNVDMQEAAKKLDEVIDAVRKEGALCGIHCCGNTDWSFLLKRNIDILSLDIYTFMKEFFLYAPDVKNFLRRDGTIAWGVVPAGDAIEKETKKTLAEKMKEIIKISKDKGIVNEELSSLITPSCGVGTLEEDKAEKVFKAAKALSDDIGK